MRRAEQNINGTVAKIFLPDRQPRLLVAGAVPRLLSAGSPKSANTCLPKADSRFLPLPEIADCGECDFYRLTLFLLIRTNSVRDFRHPACLCESLKKGTFCHYCRLTIFCRVNIEAGKLTMHAWIILKKVLEIEIENPQLTIRQAKNCRHLLNYLIIKCKLLRSEAVTKDELSKWLKMKLPKGYQELLPLIAGRATKAKSPAPNPPKGKKKKQKANQKIEPVQPATGIEAEKSVTGKRKPISGQLFNEAARRQGMYCFWCGVKVVREKQISPSLRLGKKKSKIIYLRDGIIQRVTAATIDHLERVCEGGTNDPENLVISCCHCNQRRNNQRSNYLKRVEKARITCPNCGSKFVRFDTKICSVCGTDTNRRKKSFSTGIKKHFELFRRLVEDVFRRFRKRPRR